MDFEYTGGRAGVLPQYILMGCPVVVNKYLRARTVLLHGEGTVSPWIETDSVDSVRQLFAEANIPLKVDKRWTDKDFAKECGIKL